MLCEKCGVNTATNFYTRTVNGVTEKHQLCQACAGENSGDFWSQLISAEELGGLLAGLFAIPTQNMPANTPCEACGSTLSEITSSGMLGCPACYAHFERELEQNLLRLHGKTVHMGKIPKNAAPRLRKKRVLEKLKNELSSAVGEERFEDAAKLRDKIKQIESEGTHDEEVV